MLRTAAEQAGRAGAGWNSDEIRLLPAPKLVELIQKSRQVLAAEQPSE